MAGEKLRRTGATCRMMSDYCSAGCVQVFVEIVESSCSATRVANIIRVHQNRERGTAMNKRMRRVTNWLGMQRQSADVIDEGYRWLLGRPADPAGLQWLCSRLRGLSTDQAREQVRAI